VELAVIFWGPREGAVRVVRTAGGPKS